jgi:8-oxo-dGTP diphosphatase
VKDAVVIILRRDSRVLIVLRGAGIRRGGYWAPPSGRVENDETHEQAVVREAMEELGIVVDPLREIWRSVTDDDHYALHWWTARIVSGEPTPDRVEVDEIRWCTAGEFLALEPIFESHREFFECVLPALAPD